MSLRESLGMLSENLAMITFPPDKYPTKSITYEKLKANILRLWGEARPKIKRDLERAQQIDSLLPEMFAAFESGDFLKGCGIAMEIWGSNIKKLR